MLTNQKEYLFRNIIYGKKREDNKKLKKMHFMNIRQTCYILQDME